MPFFGRIVIIIAQVITQIAGQREPLQPRLVVHRFVTGHQRCPATLLVVQCWQWVVAAFPWTSAGRLRRPEQLVEAGDIIGTTIRFEPYAYVIYDLDHRRNADFVLNHLLSRGIHSAGRFAQFEYLNTDGVVEQTHKLAAHLNASAPPDTQPPE